ncbi:MAG: hypothetical protein ACTSVZ_10050 [Promethearchaeota archaeon]
MGSWDEFSFSNDDVMDLLQVPIANRTLMVSCVDFRHHPFSLQEIINLWYSFSFKDRIALLDDILKKDPCELETVGIALMFAGNKFLISNAFATISLGTLARFAKYEKYLE